MNNLLSVISRKGIIDTVVHGSHVVMGLLRSHLTAYLLRIRGIVVTLSIFLGGNNIFFSSKKNSINIGPNVRFGRNTRLDAGFGGRISIGEDVLIDDNCFITAQNSIRIGDHVQISAYCFITDFNHNFATRSKPIVEQGCNTKPVIICDDVWIGAHTCILAGVTVGKGSIVGAGAVVTKNVPPYTIVAGNPAREIGKRP